MEAGVDSCHLAWDFCEILNAGSKTGDITIKEYCTGLSSGIEWLAAEECKAAIQINC